MAVLNCEEKATMSKIIEPIKKTITVPVPIKQAFDIFTNKFSQWWPQDYTWSQAVLDTIGIEPRKGGRCFERGPDGFECQWGTVLEWQPPKKLIFLWQISPKSLPVPDPRKASEVEVQFIADSSKTTRIEFEHRNFEHHGEGENGYREEMDSPYGWTKILENYAAVCKMSKT